MSHGHKVSKAYNTVKQLHSTITTTTNNYYYDWHIVSTYLPVETVDLNNRWMSTWVSGHFPYLFEYCIRQETIFPQIAKRLLKEFGFKF